MKRLLAWLMSGLLMAGLILSLGLSQPAHADELRNIADDKMAETVGKVDLNNCSVRRFQQYPGMYPTLAGKIVLGGPYESVDDVSDKLESNGSPAWNCSKNIRRTSRSHRHPSPSTKASIESMTVSTAESCTCGSSEAPSGQ
jgi:hypothetical protein